jgi:hypothetical protein
MMAKVQRPPDFDIDTYTSPRPTKAIKLTLILTRKWRFQKVYAGARARNRSVAELKPERGPVVTISRGRKRPCVQRGGPYSIGNIHKKPELSPGSILSLSHLAIGS